MLFWCCSGAFCRTLPGAKVLGPARTMAPGGPWPRREGGNLKPAFILIIWPVSSGLPEGLAKDPPRSLAKATWPETRGAPRSLAKESSRSSGLRSSAKGLDWRPEVLGQGLRGIERGPCARGPWSRTSRVLGQGPWCPEVLGQGPWPSEILGQGGEGG